MCSLVAKGYPEWVWSTLFGQVVMKTWLCAWCFCFERVLCHWGGGGSQFGHLGLPVSKQTDPSTQKQTHTTKKHVVEHILQNCYLRVIPTLLSSSYPHHFFLVFLSDVRQSWV